MTKVIVTAFIFITAVMAIYTVADHEGLIETETTAKEAPLALHLDSNISDLGPEETGPALMPGQTDTYPAMSHAEAEAYFDTGEGLYEFVEWIDSDRGKVMSASPMYAFILTRERSFEAVYRRVGEGRLSFYDINHDIIRRVDARDYDLQAMPTDDELPLKPGWTFTGEWTEDITGSWSQEGAESLTPYMFKDVEKLSGHVRLYPIYERTDPERRYDVIIEGKDDRLDILYDTRISVDASEITPPEGGAFSHWTLEGEPVSYSETYTMSVLSDADLAPVFKESSEEKALMTLRPTAFETDSHLFFTSQYYLPDTAEYKESGLLVHEGASGGALRIDSDDADIVPSSYKSPADEFTTALSVEAGATYTVRSYLYFTEDGEEQVVYSEQREHSITHSVSETLSMEDGESVLMEGIVLAHDHDARGVFLQDVDKADGIFVRNTYGAFDHVEVGNLITVSGEIGRYTHTIHDHHNDNQRLIDDDAVLVANDGGDHSFETITDMEQLEILNGFNTYDEDPANPGSLVGSRHYRLEAVTLVSVNNSFEGFGEIFLELEGTPEHFHNGFMFKVDETPGFDKEDFEDGMTLEYIEFIPQRVHFGAYCIVVTNLVVEENK